MNNILTCVLRVFHSSADTQSVHYAPTHASYSHITHDRLAAHSSRSKTAAAPMPVPMHMEMTP